MRKKKVVIIGAGPAGLTAGYQLLKKSRNYKVIILESSNDIGGISKTVKYKHNRMDIGGHRFFSKKPEVIKFWKEIMPVQGKDSVDDKKLKREKKLEKGGPDPEVEDRVMLIRNRVSRIYYLKKFFDYPISIKFKTFKNLGFKRTLLVSFSYLKSMIIKKKEDSLENFYINRFGKKLYKMFFLNYTKKVWGQDPSEISADWGKQKVETSLIEEFLYPKYGPGQFWEMVALEFEKMGGVILKNKEVSKIKQKDGKIKSVMVGDEEIKGDIFISSMPLKDLVNDLSDTPKEILDIALGLPYRDFVTIGLLVKKINLKNETDIKTLGNIIPDCWIYVQDTDIKLGRIQIFNNWSPYMVKSPSKTVWLGLEYFCNEGDDFWNMDERECINFAINELLKMGIISENTVLDAHLEKVKKAYPAYFGTYFQIDKLIEYLNKFDNLYCVGRNGQHRYNNMDHSMLTSFEAVNNILNNIKDKSLPTDSFEQTQ